MTNTYEIDIVFQEIVNHNLLVKALIQDINHCTGPLELLNELNCEGRTKLAALRKHIDRLESLAKEQEKPLERIELLREVASHKEQLTSTLSAFRKANVACLLSIERSNKEELFDEVSEEANLRHRQKKDKKGLVKISSNVTEQLLSISRHLADTTQRSADTLDSLGRQMSLTLRIHQEMSKNTQQELLTTGSVITQSGKLLDKYGRREFTDKVLLFFAFAFFLACVVYIVQKRIF